MERWEPGTHVVRRGIVHNRVWNARLVTVVRDLPDLLVVYFGPGAAGKVSRGLVERKYVPTQNAISRWDEQDARDWELIDWPWKERRALVLMPPWKYYSVFLFWTDETDEFEGWYVNFELPFHRTDASIDTFDLEIDLIIKPDGSWHWKDEADYQEGVRRGAIAADTAARVEEAREEVLALIASGSPLFDGEWLEWRPDPTWENLELPIGWETVAPRGGLS